MPFQAGSSGSGGPYFLAVVYCAAVGLYLELFKPFEIFGRIALPYAMPYETDQPIYVLRGMNMPLQYYWPKVNVSTGAQYGPASGVQL